MNYGTSKWTSIYYIYIYVYINNIDEFIKYHMVFNLLAWRHRSKRQGVRTRHSGRPGIKPSRIWTRRHGENLGLGAWGCRIFLGVFWLANVVWLAIFEYQMVLIIYLLTLSGLFWDFLMFDKRWIKKIESTWLAGPEILALVSNLGWSITFSQVRHDIWWVIWD